MPDPGSSTSVAALIVSICSATVALLGFLANLTLYKLSGARLKVQLVFSYAEDGSRTWSTEGRNPALFSQVGFDPPASRFGIEYGRVRVTNIGRTAVSVENISFDISPRYRWYPRRRSTVQPMQFRRKDEDAAKEHPDLSAPIRLEPGGHVTADLHLWPTLAAGDHGTGGGAIRIRGSAQAVGRKRATRSSRRRSWTLPKGAWTLFRDIEVTPELRVFRELWWQNYRESVASSIALLMFREINDKLSQGATKDDIQDYLDSHTKDLDGGPWFNGWIAYSVHHTYHHETPAIWRESRPKPPGRYRQLLRRALWGQTKRKYGDH